ncbi:hypothetical protein Bca101_083123 [Brassica carinata]
MSLSPSAMITYDSLVQDFTLDRIGVTEMTASLSRLLKKDEFLHQLFLEATNELKQEQEDANGEIQGVIKVDEIAKEDPRVHDEESNLEADLENAKEDVTLETIPSYELIPEEDECSLQNEVGEIVPSTTYLRRSRAATTPRPFVRRTRGNDVQHEERSLAVDPKTVLNNEFRQLKVETPRPKKLSGYKKEVADYEDERYQNDMMIENLRSAVKRWDKVMKKEMRI